MYRRTFCRSFFLVLFFIYLGGAVYFYVQTNERVENVQYNDFDPEVVNVLDPEGVDTIERKRKIHDIQIEYDEKFVKGLDGHGFPEKRNKPRAEKESRRNTRTENNRVKPDRNAAIRLGVTNIIEKVNILKEQLNRRNLTVFGKYLKLRNSDIAKPVIERINISSKERDNLPSGNKFGMLNKRVRLFRKNTVAQVPKKEDISRDKELKRATQFLPKIKSIEDSEIRRFRNRKQIHLNKYQANFEEILPKIFLYSAFLDTRGTIANIRMVIVTLAGKQIPTTVWCHFSISGNSDELISSEVSFYETCENHSKNFAAYIASCKVPRDDVNLSSVWISDKPDPPNTKETPPIRIIYNKPSNKSGKYAVCIPPLFGKVNVLRLAEFIEFTRILGAEHFTFYNNGVEGDIKHVLEYYGLLNIATTLPWSLPVANDKIWYHGQSAAVWDCLYRNMYLYKRVAFLDFDEFIIPQNHNTWDELFAFLQKQGKVADDSVVSAYRFLSAFFDPEFYGPIHDLSFEESQLVNINVTMRTTFFSAIRTKLLVDPTKIFELGIHHVSKPLKEDYKVVTIDTELAYIHHHRKCDPNWGMNCSATKKDTSAWKYRDQLLNFTRWRLQRVQKYIDKKSSRDKNINKSV